MNGCPTCGLPLYVFADGKRTTVTKVIEGRVPMTSIKYVQAHALWCESEDNRLRKLTYWLTNKH